MNYLLFQIYGLFQAWGLPLPGNIRKCDDHPTKSGIMGYVASCIGITDDMESEFIVLANQMRFACRVDSPGHMTKDFHTVQADPPYNNIISERFYLTDAGFTICLWGDADLEKIAEAINMPKYIPFLGRKSCTSAIPPNPKVIVADNLKDAFSQYEAPEFLLNKDSDVTTIFWEGDNSGLVSSSQIRRRDESVGIRKHVSRIEHVSYIGGKHVSK